MPRQCRAISSKLSHGPNRNPRRCGAQPRPADDFALALPGLERVLDLTREVAFAKAEALGTSPYEALLDQYEPGGSTALIDRLFDELSGFLPRLLDAALA